MPRRSAPPSRPLLLPATAQAGTLTAGLGLAYTAAAARRTSLAVDAHRRRSPVPRVRRFADRRGAATCEHVDRDAVRCDGGARPGERSTSRSATGDDRLSSAPLGGAVRVARRRRHGRRPARRVGGDRLRRAARRRRGDRPARAGTGESDLTGGPGADTLTGGPGGALTTYLMGAAPDGADPCQGGAGFDVAGYAQRTGAADAAADGVADDGAAGEGDDLAASRRAARGRRAAPTCSPASAAVRRRAERRRPGDDELTGGPGADLLAGGDGDDALAGGAGDDLARRATRSPRPAGRRRPGPERGQRGRRRRRRVRRRRRLRHDRLRDPARPGHGRRSTGSANDGEAGERDNAGADVEALTGGRGADTLTGSAARRADHRRRRRRHDRPRRRASTTCAPATATTPSARRTAAASGSPAAPAPTRSTGDHDDVPVSCETATLGPAPAARDTRKPQVRIGGLPQRPRYHHVRRGLRPRLSADEPAAFVVELLGAATTRAHLGAPAVQPRARAPHDRAHRPSRAGSRCGPSAALLGPRRKLRVRIRVTATDAAGNVRVVRQDAQGAPLATRNGLRATSAPSTSSRHS